MVSIVILSIQVATNKPEGIWDCQSSQAVIEFVRRGIAQKQELEEICENMMDNCLASSSETGGVGCDNMTMCIIGLLNGKSKEEWYEEIVARVKNGDGPCAPPAFGKSFLLYVSQLELTLLPGDFRGPGVHHTWDDSHHSIFERERRNEAAQGWGNPRGPSTFSGAYHFLTDLEDTEMFDRAEEKDLDNQVNTADKPKDGTATNTDALPDKLDPAHFKAEIEKHEKKSKAGSEREKQD